MGYFNRTGANPNNSAFAGPAFDCVDMYGKFTTYISYNGGVTPLDFDNCVGVEYRTDDVSVDVYDCPRNLQYLEPLTGSPAPRLCDKDESNLKVKFYLGRWRNEVFVEEYDPACTLEIPTQDGAYGDFPVDWDCLEKWCDDINKVDPFDDCQINAEIVIEQVYDIEKCVLKGPNSDIVQNEFKKKRDTRGVWNNLTDVFRNDPTEELLKSHMKIALECICKAVRARDKKKLLDAFIFMDAEKTYYVCWDRAKAICLEKFGVSNALDLDVRSDRFREFMQCHVEESMICMIREQERLVNC